MCTSKPKVKPVAAAPVVSPITIDDAAVAERDRERQRQRVRAGRQATILAGNTGAPTTTSAKTALGQ
jgi:hypothetical protein